MTISVDVPFTQDREGLEFHEFFEQRCVGEVRVFMFDEDGAILSLVEDHTGSGHSRSLQAYAVCEAWLNHFDLNDHGYRVEFSDSREAMLFKLTLGGS